MKDKVLNKIMENLQKDNSNPEETVFKTIISFNKDPYIFDPVINHFKTVGFCIVQKEDIYGDESPTPIDSYWIEKEKILFTEKELDMIYNNKTSLQDLLDKDYTFKKINSIYANAVSNQEER